MGVSGEFVFLNGAVLPADEAAISPFDAGLLRGYAVFDLLQTLRGEPFMLEEHLARFRGSAAMLGLRVPLDDEGITAVIHELLERNAHAEATVRMVLTGGVSPDGMHFDPTTPTFLIITHELFEIPASAYDDGARLLLVEHRRELPEAKTTGYLTWLKNHGRIEAEGAMDLLYHSDGLVSEAATASFYVVSGGRVLAPREGVLWGTVGSKVLEIAEAEYEVVRCDISVEQALAADEAFITSSVRGVVPVVRLDDHVIGDGRPGPVTRRLSGLFRAETGL